jgi:hypothetical protein
MARSTSAALLAVLRDMANTLTARELAETLWLAERSVTATASQTERQVPVDAYEADARNRVHRISARVRQQAPATRSQSANPAAAMAPAQRAPKIAEVRAAVMATPPFPETDKLSLPVPTTQALPRQMQIIRALRPLKRRAASRRRYDLDEAATADVWAECVAAGTMGQVVLWPAQDRWLRVALVVEASPSMMLWRATADEFAGLLAGSGIFRDVRRWELEAPGSKRSASTGGLPVHLRASHGGMLRSSRDAAQELLDPEGRSLVLLVSDCVAEGWRDGTAAAFIVPWVRAGALALVQVLPPTLWPQTGLAVARPLWLRSQPVGGFARRLMGRENVDRKRAIETRLEEIPPAALLCLEERWLTPWSRIVTGAPPPAQARGIALPLNMSIKKQDKEEDSETLLRNFRSAASPAARHLARMLAAVPLTMPIIRLVHAAIQPGAPHAVLAEVLFSGLIRQLPNTTFTGEPAFDFVEGARTALIGSASRAEVIDVLTRVGDHIGERIAQKVNFPAWLSTNSSETDIPEGATLFARIATQTLRQLGGAYAKAAERLEAQSRREAPQPNRSRTASAVAEVVPDVIARSIGMIGNGIGILVEPRLIVTTKLAVAASGASLPGSVTIWFHPTASSPLQASWPWPDPPPDRNDPLTGDDLARVAAALAAAFTDKEIRALLDEPLPYAITPLHGSSIRRGASARFHAVQAVVKRLDQPGLIPQIVRSALALRPFDRKLGRLARYLHVDASQPLVYILEPAGNDLSPCQIPWGKPNSGQAVSVMIPSGRDMVTVPAIASARARRHTDRSSTLYVHFGLEFSAMAARAPAGAPVFDGGYQQLLGVLGARLQPDQSGPEWTLVTKREFAYELAAGRAALIEERGKPVLVAGTGQFKLPENVWPVADSVGLMLAREGHTLVCGGWQGVDHVVARTFDYNVRSATGIGRPHRLVQVLATGAVPDYSASAGTRVIIGEDGWPLTSVRLCNAAVLVGGEGGTYQAFEECLRQGRPVVPLESTGGDAASAAQALRLGIRQQSFPDPRALASVGVAPFLPTGSRSFRPIATSLANGVSRLLGTISDPVMRQNYQDLAATLLRLVRAWAPDVPASPISDGASARPGQHYLLSVAMAAAAGAEERQQFQIEQTVDLRAAAGQLMEFLPAAAEWLIGDLIWIDREEKAGWMAAAPLRAAILIAFLRKVGRPAFEAYLVAKVEEAVTSALDYSALLSATGSMALSQEQFGSVKLSQEELSWFATLSERLDVAGRRAGVRAAGLRLAKDVPVQTTVENWEEHARRLRSGLSPVSGQVTRAVLSELLASHDENERILGYSLCGRSDIRPQVRDLVGQLARERGALEQRDGRRALSFLLDALQTILPAERLRQSDQLALLLELHTLRKLFQKRRSRHPNDKTRTAVHSLLDLLAQHTSNVLPPEAAST